MSPDINRVIESIPRVAIDKAPGGIPWGQVDMEEYKNPFSTHFHRQQPSLQTKHL